MSNDRYERIRAALAKELTPGPWNIKDGRTDTVENAQGYPVCTVHWYPDERYGHGARAAYIAACDPDTIRELIAERDQLAAALEAAREDAERYRWLRDSDMFDPESQPDSLKDAFARYTGSRLDAAIDQARGKGEP